MLALPYAFAVQGWAVGMTTLLLAALGSATGQMMLSVCAQRLHSRSTSYGACTRASQPLLPHRVLLVPIFLLSLSSFLLLPLFLPLLLLLLTEVDIAGRGRPVCRHPRAAFTGFSSAQTPFHPHHCTTARSCCVLRASLPSLEPQLTKPEELACSSSPPAATAAGVY